MRRGTYYFMPIWCHYSLGDRKSLFDCLIGKLGAHLAARRARFFNEQNEVHIFDLINAIIYAIQFSYVCFSRGKQISAFYYFNST